MLQTVPQNGKMIFQVTQTAQETMILPHYWTA